MWQTLKRSLPLLTYLGMTCVSALALTASIVLFLIAVATDSFDGLQGTVMYIASMLVVSAMLLLPLLTVSFCLAVVMIVVLIVGAKTERIRVVLWSGLAVLTGVLTDTFLYLFAVGSAVTGALSLWWLVLAIRCSGSTPSQSR